MMIILKEILDRGYATKRRTTKNGQRNRSPPPLTCALLQPTFARRLLELICREEKRSHQSFVIVDPSAVASRTGGALSGTY